MKLLAEWRSSTMKSIFHQSLIPADRHHYGLERAVLASYFIKKG
jgi:hypothetical protein